MKWGLKGGISIYADSGPPRYVLWCCGCICHQPDTFIQIGSGHTVPWMNVAPGKFGFTKNILASLSTHKDVGKPNSAVLEPSHSAIVHLPIYIKSKSLVREAFVKVVEAVMFIGLLNISEDKFNVHVVAMLFCFIVN